MKKLKRVLAVIMMMVMMVPVTAFAAEDPSPAKKSVNGAVAAEATFNGKVQSPVITLGDQTLVEGVDYEVVGTLAHRNATTATATIKGIGAFEGEATVTFTIKPASIKDVKIVVGKYTYNGKKQKAGTVVTLNGVRLSYGKDYNYVSGSTRTAAGSNKLVIAGKSNLTGKTTATLTVNKAKQTVTAKANKTVFKASDLKKKAGAATIKTTGVKAGAKVTYTSSNKNIKISKTGKVTVAKGTKAGKYQVKVSVAATKNYLATTKTISIVVK